MTAIVRAATGYVSACVLSSVGGNNEISLGRAMTRCSCLCACCARPASFIVDLLRCSARRCRELTRWRVRPVDMPGPTHPTAPRAASSPVAARSTLTGWWRDDLMSLRRTSELVVVMCSNVCYFGTDSLRTLEYFPKRLSMRRFSNHEK